MKKYYIMTGIGLLMIWTSLVFIFGEHVYKEIYTGEQAMNKKASVVDTIAYTNYLRTSHNLPKLVENSTLDKIAKIKACDMRDRHYFEHEDPDGQMPWHLYIDNMYYYTWAGENIAQGYTGQNEMMTALFNSPEHRDNILNPHYTEIGVATCGIYYVQEYGAK